MVTGGLQVVPLSEKLPTSGAAAVEKLFQTTYMRPKCGELGLSSTAIAGRSSPLPVLLTCAHGAIVHAVPFVDCHIPIPTLDPQSPVARKPANHLLSALSKMTAGSPKFARELPVNGDGRSRLNVWPPSVETEAPA